MPLSDESWRQLAHPVRALLPVTHSLIFCFFFGKRCPSAACPMLRLPAPATGDVFNEGFAEIYRAAIALNPSIHDGAVLVGRDDVSEPYRVRGWSHRLFSSAEAEAQTANRGSAWNSCLAMSLEGDVEALILAAPDGLFGFSRGLVRDL